MKCAPDTASNSKALERSLADAIDERDNALAALEELRQRIDAQNDILSRLSAELAASRVALATEQAEKLAALVELERARQRAKTLETEIVGTAEELSAANEEVRSTAEELQATNELLREANELLERRVSDRTRELRTLAHRLQEEVRSHRVTAAVLEQAKADAEAANLAKTRFLAAASHDLRQPLQAMQNLVHLLAVRLTDDETQEIVRQLRSSIQANTALLNALLDISKLDAGIVQPQIKPFILASLSEQLMTEFAPVAESKALVLRGVPCHRVVLSDPALLGAVLRNLLANAIRYTRAGRILLGCRRRNGTLRVEVWDTGVGIPRDQLQAIFRDFHQLENPERDREKGFGIGLSVVDRLARLLGHPIGVHSKLGKGSVFWIELPLGVQAAEPHLAADQPVELTGRTVAVVEDDQLQLAALCMLFQDWGCRVAGHPTADGLEEILARDGLTPDVVVSDFRLRGGANGLDVITRIRAACDRWIPGLLLTGDTDPERLRQARQANLELLHKPFDPAELHAAVARALRTPTT